MLPAERSVALLHEVLAAQAELLVRVRAADAKMIACLFVRADDAAVRLCRKLGLELRPGGTGVLGLLGTDAARAFPELTGEPRGWLETPCGPRETKVLLVEGGGMGLLSLHAEGGRVSVTAVHAAPDTSPA
jgi:hypothetical protein